MKTGNKHIPDVRNSKSINDVKLRDAVDLVSFKTIGAIYPRHYRDDVYLSDEIDHNDAGLKWKLHCYETGGYFTKHSDGKKSTKHFATLLVFPPSHYSPFEGGDLILYLENQGPVIVQTSLFQEWTVVAFHINILHECTAVTNGREFCLQDRT